MSERAAIWKKRVASWRASGKTAKAFSAGREWSAGTLLWWSSRLRHEKPAPVVRMAQLIRPSPDWTRGRGAIVVERLDGGIRVIIEHDADRETVATVLALVTSRSDR
jgi:hypothetical protein